MKNTMRKIILTPAIILILTGCLSPSVEKSILYTESFEDELSLSCKNSNALYIERSEDWASDESYSLLLAFNSLDENESAVFSFDPLQKIKLSELKKIKCDLYNPTFYTPGIYLNLVTNQNKIKSSVFQCSFGENEEIEFWFHESAENKPENKNEPEGFIESIEIVIEDGTYGFELYVDNIRFLQN